MLIFACQHWKCLRRCMSLLWSCLFLQSHFSSLPNLLHSKFCNSPCTLCCLFTHLHLLSVVLFSLLLLSSGLLPSENSFFSFLTLARLDRSSFYFYRTLGISLILFFHSVLKFPFSGLFLLICVCIVLGSTHGYIYWKNDQDFHIFIIEPSCGQ